MVDELVPQKVACAGEPELETGNDQRAARVAECQLNDLADSPHGPYVRTAFNILDKWGCTPPQIQAMLQISSADYELYRNSPSSAELSEEQLLRVGLLLNIHAGLRILFENPENVYGFMSQLNGNAPFNGCSPLSIAGSGSLMALQDIALAVDALVAG